MASLIRQVPIMAATHLINAALTGAVLWGMMPGALVIVWVGAIWLNWGWLLTRWRRRRGGPVPERVSQRAIRRAVVRSAFAGLLWGFAGLAMFPDDSLLHQLLLAFVIGGMCAGAVAAMSIFPAACQAYILTSAPPLALRFFMAGDTISIVMGLMFSLFIGSLLIVSRNSFKTFLESIHKELENSTLLKRLALARDDAQAANKAKSAFLANMSHELRTPLNAIIGFSEIMQKEILGALNPRYKDYAADIRDSGEHLLSLVNDVLDLSKVEAGKYEPREEDVNVADAVAACLRIVRERADAAELGLTTEVAAGLPALRADARAVKQIVINLLSNAIKFTPNGGRIVVRVTVDRHGAFSISVEDTGIGIAPQDLPTVFAPFQQVDGSLSRKYQGAGLGLPLVKSLVELHGGTVDLRSELGAGTTVTLRFPPARTGEPRMQPSAADDGAHAAAS